METNIRTGQAPKRAPDMEKVIETDPFATPVDGTTVKKQVIRKASTATAGDVVKAVKKTVSKTAKMLGSDPFAEIADTTSPVKKRAVKTATAGAKALKNSSKAETRPLKFRAKTGKAEAAKKVIKRVSGKAALDATAEIAAAVPKVELSPVFRALADVTLPELQRENRAWLQMQTPTRLYFYWSVKENPWAMLRNVFGDDFGSYTLVVKLIDKRLDREEIQQCEAEGTWWFDVEPDHAYQAEIGFYAPNRPYFRVLHSNTVETPRRGPSPRVATDADWRVSAIKFAEVLDVAGFSRDAFDVVMAGDDANDAESTSQLAISRFLGKTNFEFKGITPEDIRYAMLALASGVMLNELRGKIGAALFAVLQANAENLESGRAMSALTEYFDIDEADFTEEQFGAAVYGASLVNFPRTLKTRTVSSYNPLSSHSFR